MTKLFNNIKFVLKLILIILRINSEALDYICELIRLMSYYNKALLVAQEGIEICHNDEDRDKFLNLIKMIRNKHKIYQSSFVNNLTKIDYNKLGYNNTLKLLEISEI